jgi:hypothetical protein
MHSIKESGSKLVPVGVLFILLGFGGPIIAERLVPSGQLLNATMAMAVDGFRVGFFFGLALLIVGLLRNRKKKQSGEKA